jgi:hypothetical protein
MSHPEFWVGSFFLVKRRTSCTLVVSKHKINRRSSCIYGTNIGSL